MPLENSNRKPRILVFSGAGLSAESGIPTFRGADGLWEGYRIEEVCDYTTWKQNAEAVHRFYNERRANVANAQPNDAHMRLASWQKRGWDVRLITANVDDLLERAGCTDVLHVHGKLSGMMCTACGHKWEIGFRAWDIEHDRCPVKRCGSKKGVKPDVVFFHERAPAYAPMIKAFRELADGDMAIVTGTSLSVIPVHEMLIGKHGVARILNVLNLEDIQNVARVAQGFDRVIAASATVALRDIESMIANNPRHLENA